MGEDWRHPRLDRARRRAGGGAGGRVFHERGSFNASALFGVALAALGCLTLILGTVQFLRNRRSISERNFVPAAAAYVAVVAGGLAFAGAFILYVLLQ